MFEFLAAQHKVEAVLKKVMDEFDRATAKHGPMSSYPDSIGVIEEEIDELWDEIKKQDIDENAVFTESVQVAAVSVRALYDLHGLNKDYIKKGITSAINSGAGRSESLHSMRTIQKSLLNHMTSLIFSDPFKKEEEDHESILITKERLKLAFIDMAATSIYAVVMFLKKETFNEQCAFVSEGCIANGQNPFDN